MSSEHWFSSFNALVNPHAMIEITTIKRWFKDRNNNTRFFFFSVSTRFWKDSTIYTPSVKLSTLISNLRIYLFVSTRRSFANLLPMPRNGTRWAWNFLDLSVSTCLIIIIWQRYLHVQWKPVTAPNAKLLHKQFDLIRFFSYSFRYFYGHSLRLLITITHYGC